MFIQARLCKSQGFSKKNFTGFIQTRLCCGRTWPAAYINFNQNIHQIQVLTKPMPCSGYILFAAEQRAGYQISRVDLQREVNCP